MNMLNINFVHWSREHNAISDIANQVVTSDIIILLIKDDAIEDFFQQHISSLLDNDKIVVHFSNCIYLDDVVGCAPLCVFANKLYDCSFYENIIFAIDHGKYSLQDIFPKMPNNYFVIPSSYKAYYHAWCCMAGNFTCLLWKKCIDNLSQLDPLLQDGIKQYMQSVFLSLQQDPAQAMTGPLVRNDTDTIDLHLAALRNCDEKELYKTFVSYYRKLHK
ncbi:MAG: DUF2520 domain-containing protein [Candidatus Endonucleobacter sp. (ex Gigantidas childressi)]|nr:DUF2520 domain-containing protein [Candidatus Endonucleobacter sp. (ex Gigantidas childressi)]